MYNQMPEEHDESAFITMIKKLSNHAWVRALARTLMHQSFIEAFEHYSPKKGNIAKTIIILTSLAYRGVLIWFFIETIVSSKYSTSAKQLIVAVIAGAVANFFGNMGNIFSEEKAEKDRTRAEERHLEVMGTLAKLGGDEAMVEKFKKEVFQEHREVFINELAGMNQKVLDQLSTMNMVNVGRLDVMDRYEPIEHLTPNELRQ